MWKKSDLAVYKEVMKIKNGFFVKRHGEHRELLHTRHKFAIELVTVRDKIADKRHGERIELVNIKFEKGFATAFKEATDKARLQQKKAHATKT